MNVSRFTVQVSAFVLYLSLFVGLTFTHPTGAAAQTNKIMGSATDNGITLTINGYSFINNGQGVKLYYTIQSTSSRGAAAKNLMAKPDILIGDNLLHGTNEQHQKISPQKYTGTINVRLPDYRHVPSYVEFNTYGILNQRGQWTVDFTIK
ncbi:MAG TPA: hypothetical protein VFK33_04885 [Bacillales bacterium]|nr:hypothetical protein [Bacillales bacterium]